MDEQLAFLVESFRAFHENPNYDFSGKKCYGLQKRLNLVEWIVPYGYTGQDRAFCKACAEEFNQIGKSIVVYDLPCNCDCYLLRSLLDDGVINLSFWNEDLSKPYITPDKATVAIADARGIRLLVDCYGLEKGVSFKEKEYAFQLTVKCDEEVVFITPKTTFFQRHALVPIPFNETTLEVTVILFKKEHINVVSERRNAVRAQTGSFRLLDDKSIVHNAIYLKQMYDQEENKEELSHRDEYRPIGHPLNYRVQVKIDLKTEKEEEARSDGAQREGGSDDKATGLG